MPRLVLSKGMPFDDVSTFFSLRRRGLFCLPCWGWGGLERKVVALSRSIKLALSLRNGLLSLGE